MEEDEAQEREQHHQNQSKVAEKMRKLNYLRVANPGKMTKSITTYGGDTMTHMQVKLADPYALLTSSLQFQRNKPILSQLQSSIDKNESNY